MSSPDDEQKLGLLNGSIIAPDELKVGIEALLNMSEGGEDLPDDPLERLFFEIFHALPLGGDPYKKPAILFRLIALHRVLRTPSETGVHFLKRPNGTVSVSMPLLVAVATEPLVLRGGRFCFDAEALLKRARQLRPEYEDDYWVEW